MNKTYFSFIETTWFTKQVTRVLSDEEYSSLQRRLIQLPDIGDMIPGGGGIRKFRFSAKGKGTRGGSRVIYYFAASREQIYMLEIYSKNERADITLPRLRELKRLVEEWLKDEL
jgi:hypothetical protein